MKLYKVTCHGGYENKSTIVLYVVAKSPNKAQKKALKKMEDANYTYTSYAGNVEYIASESLYNRGILCV